MKYGTRERNITSARAGLPLLINPGPFEPKKMQAEIPTNRESMRTMVGSVLRLYASRWLSFILTILKNEADAEDVIQEAVRRVLTRDIFFHSEDELRKYLGRAIANAAFELYNRRKRERRRESCIDEQNLPPLYSSSPFVSLMEAEKSSERERLLILLDSGLKQLPIKQYEALRLTILESGGLSIRDVGMMHGIPYSTLRHRSKQGLRHLRNYLEARSKQP
jgi:RNA polymerase sigma factor (sigma-70 family)